MLTLWASEDDVTALERSPDYRATVAAIMATGFIREASDAIAASVSEPSR